MLKQRFGLPGSFLEKKKQIVYKIQFSYKASFLVVFLEMFIILWIAFVNMVKNRQI